MSQRSEPWLLPPDEVISLTHFRMKVQISNITLGGDQKAHIKAVERRKKDPIVKQKTACQRLSRGFKRIAQWCRRNRHLPVSEQHQELCRKLQGHFAYYGITGNGLWLKKYEQGIRRIWQKWLHRRSRSSTDMPWDRFARLMERYRFPPPRIVHSVYAAKP
jgi:hypothetical protein